MKKCSYEELVGTKKPMKSRYEALVQAVVNTTERTTRECGAEQAAVEAINVVALHLLQRRAKYVVQAPWNQDVPGLAVVLESLRECIDALMRNEMSGGDGARFHLAECQAHAHRVKCLSECDEQELGWTLAMVRTIIDDL